MFRQRRCQRCVPAAVLGLFVVVGLPDCACLEERSIVTPDGRTRTFRVHAPDDVAGSLPIVLVLHGGGGNAEQTQKSLSFDALADDNGFVAVYPEGTGRSVLGTHFGTWNSDEECCGDALENGVDDVAFIDQLIDEVGARFGGDVDHVFATGLSNGGDMSHRLGCELSDRIDAIAPVGAPRVIGTCDPAQPVATMIIHGTDDPCALYDGGDECGGCFSRAMADLGLGGDDADANDHFSCIAAPDVAADWRVRNGCADAPSSITFENGDTACETWAEGCADAEVTLCTVGGGGHSWPGTNRACEPGRKVCDAVAKATGPVSDDIDGAAEVWRFFDAHR
jgi:polyhydroxybutyrate depolymerase